MGIMVENLTKRFGTFTAVDGVNFEVEQGKRAARAV